ncbi:papilin-like [Mesocricetus auratus]|uniref:Papilin-like n=1 Tax=Mesocricetus auratus TaxID=10036 RepID=A0ABM2X2H6_MESAU|nr:papilin-like [Mesocricetus auratus]XP_040597060.1 papilin-like [Mesocricetus auratus]
MKEESPFMNLLDGDFSSPSRKTGSRLSISTIVDAMCCLGPMAEETLGLIEKNRLNDAPTKINVISGRKRGNILGEIWHVPKTHSPKNPTGPPTARSTLRRARSEPAMPTFVASEDTKGQEINKVAESKSSSRSSSPDLYKLLDMSWPWNSAPRFSPVSAYIKNKTTEVTDSTASSDDSDTSEDYLSCLTDTSAYDADKAETEETSSDTMLSVISLNGLWFQEDTCGTGMPGSHQDANEAESEETGSDTMLSITLLEGLWFRADSSTGRPGPQQGAEVPASISTSGVLKKTDAQCSERAHDTIDILDAPQSENTGYENDNEIQVEESPPISSKDQSQEVATASKKKHRRGWRRVRRQIHHLFSSLFCCLLTPKTEDTVPRSEEQAWAHGS